MIISGLNEVLIASVNAKRNIPESNPDIKEAMELIMVYINHNFLFINRIRDVTSLDLI